MYVTFFFVQYLYDPSVIGSRTYIQICYDFKLYK